MRILIAEDDLTSRTALCGLLRESGHTVVDHKNGVEAWKTMQKDDAPKLAIVDWMMPEMDGLELCENIRTADTTEPPYIIMLTAKSDNKDIVRALNAGADDYVTKPYDPQELNARINVGIRMLNLQQRLSNKVRELENALEHIHTLQGMLPICAHCKKIRDDEDYWHEVEHYIRDHSELEFTHSICPDCVEKYYSNSAKEQNTQKDQGQ